MIFFKLHRFCQIAFNKDHQFSYIPTSRMRQCTFPPIHCNNRASCLPQGNLYCCNSCLSDYWKMGVPLYIYIKCEFLNLFLPIDTVNLLITIFKYLDISVFFETKCFFFSLKKVFLLLQQILWPPATLLFFKILTSSIIAKLNTYSLMICGY